jgi:orotidine-5'-phosphate decarboxylase
VSTLDGTQSAPAPLDRATRAPIALALDGPDRETVLGWAAAAGPHVAVMKVGLETFLRDGPGIVGAVREAAPGAGLFLDLKLHDIPNTVAGAARSVAPLAPDFLTVHASGGPAMVAAAAEALPDTLITAVTVLTSLSEADLDAVGLRGPALEAAVRLARMAVANVCSPQEVAAVRAEVPASVVLVTPGVRPASGAGSAAGDQSRVATPQQALAAGSDLLVIGRPITAAEDPGAAARGLAASLAVRDGGSGAGR